ncbi:MAG: TIGR04086 family membrane protein [Clostridiales bacterium]|nr:MAG: TIGR04086 family membrane protein [Clostridiales bacterium]
MAKDMTGDFEEKKGLGTFMSNLKKYLFGVLAGSVVVTVMLCIGALILTVGGVPDGLIAAFAYIAVALGAFSAGYTALRMLRSSGILNGVITGVIMFVLQFFLSLAFSEGKVFSLQTLIYLLINCLLAALGGVAGVNIRKRRFF